MGQQDFHQLLVHSFKEYMEVNGWVHDSKIMCPVSNPDAKLRKFGVHHLIFAEVKPPHASTSEVIKGIGECSSYLWRTDILPYLVLHQDHYTKFNRLFSRPEFYWLGVYSYDNDSLELVKSSDRETTDVYGEDYFKRGKPIRTMDRKIKAKFKEHFDIPRFVVEASDAKV